jgi:hypothetical protein
MFVGARHDPAVFCGVQAENDPAPHRQEGGARLAVSQGNIRSAAELIAPATRRSSRLRVQPDCTRWLQWFQRIAMEPGLFPAGKGEPSIAVSPESACPEAGNLNPETFPAPSLQTYMNWLDGSNVTE